MMAGSPDDRVRGAPAIIQQSAREAPSGVELDALGVSQEAGEEEADSLSFLAERPRDLLGAVQMVHSGSDEAGVDTRDGRQLGERGQLEVEESGAACDAGRGVEVLLRGLVGGSSCRDAGRDDECLRRLLRLGERARRAQVVGECLTMALGWFLDLRERGRDPQMELARIRSCGRAGYRLADEIVHEPPVTQVAGGHLDQAKLLEGL
ncbi:hypothetical protein ACFQ1L_29800 [Phytohabitans flavus]|uniref:hypothetical protein n=1 Tax=Phytohabitans flavus TaxID=1076124 RepID=UPI00363C5EC8